MNGRREGRTCVVTGAGRGIGREDALSLARQGASVVVDHADGDEAGLPGSPPQPPPLPELVGGP